MVDSVALAYRRGSKRLVLEYLFCVATRSRFLQLSFHRVQCSYHRCLRLPLLGTSINNFKDYVRSFYNIEPESKVNPDFQSHLIADTRFLCRIWSWLAKHPDIQVGRSIGKHSLSLSEIESYNLQQREAIEDSEQSIPSQEAAHSGPDQPGVDQTFPRNGLHTVTPQPKTSSTPQTVLENEIRLYASTERMWLAIAGHPPDKNRVANLDFQLLSIIAASRTKGILQSDLVNISGQDLRSVPKRTDRLHEADYIEKRAVQPGKFHTSICFLKRFVRRDSQEGLDGAIKGDPNPAERHLESKSAHDANAPKDSESIDGAAGFNAEESSTASIPRLKWNGEQCIDNAIYDLVHSSGIEGLSTMVSLLIRFCETRLTDYRTLLIICVAHSSEDLLKIT